VGPALRIVPMAIAAESGFRIATFASMRLLDFSNELGGWGLLLPLTGFLRARASAGPRARFASRRKYGLQGVRQFRRAHTQLRNPVPHQPAQQFFSPRSHEHVHLAAVFRGAFSAEKSPLLHAVYQFHGAVVLDLQPLGEAANGRLLV
jgi:hypothetical protein